MVSFSLGQARAGSIYMDKMTTPSLYNGSRFQKVKYSISREVTTYVQTAIVK